MKNLNLGRWRSLVPGNKPPTHRRSLSSSSEASHQSLGSPSSRASEDQFYFSPASTPAKEKPPSRVKASQRTAIEPSAPSGRDNPFLSREDDAHPRDADGIPKVPSYLNIAPSSQSKPIAIERRQSVTSAPHPTEALSARGDIAGGYFPLHEDPQARVRATHPFYIDIDMARQASLQKAAESSRSGPEPGGTRSAGSAKPAMHSRYPGSPNLSDAAAKPPSFENPSKAEPSDSPLKNITSPLTSPHTPVSSYNPSGIHDGVVLPMGKYYPTNWEKRHGKAPLQHNNNRPPTTIQPLAAAVRFESQVPKYHGDPGHAKPGSDVKRRLQQYQRDMVAQAAMAANAVLANSPSAADHPMAASVAGPSVPKSKLAATFLKTHKPVSPRLRPVGSPGPVITPMSLEGDCYLSLGSPASLVPFDDGRLAISIPAGKGKQRRKDSGSAAVEMSAASI
ncbi:hypothetical protein N0V88_003443 [Collariella sp. IMI 366227]|nr:hypothetical protein N0V88_003443 [Collariella sp. IMI 366227]